MTRWWTRLTVCWWRGHRAPTLDPVVILRFPMGCVRCGKVLHG